MNVIKTAYKALEGSGFNHHKAPQSDLSHSAPKESETELPITSRDQEITS